MRNQEGGGSTPCPNLAVAFLHLTLVTPLPVVILWRKGTRHQDRWAEDCAKTQGQVLSSVVLESQHRNSLYLKIFNKSMLLMLTK